MKNERHIIAVRKQGLRQIGKGEEQKRRKLGKIFFIAFEKIRGNQEMTTNEEMIEEIIKKIDLKGYWNLATKKEALKEALAMKEIELIGLDALGFKYREGKLGGQKQRTDEIVKIIDDKIQYWKDIVREYGTEQPKVVFLELQKLRQKIIALSEGKK